MAFRPLKKSRSKRRLSPGHSLLTPLKQDPQFVGIEQLIQPPNPPLLSLSKSSLSGTTTPSRRTILA
jgi:hypothetical protein